MRGLRIVAAFVLAAVMAASISAAPPALGASAPLPPPRVVSTIAAHLQPLPAAEVPADLTGLAFWGVRRGVAVGKRCAGVSHACAGVVLYTADGGATWSGERPLQAALASAGRLAGGFGWAWGADALYVTRDYGRSWRRAPLPKLSAFLSVAWVSFASPEDAWMATSGGSCATQGCPLSLYGTTDGGARWRLLARDVLPGMATTGVAGALPWAEYAGGGDLGHGRGWLLSGLPASGVMDTVDGGARWRGTSTGALPGDGGPVAAAFAGPDGWATGAECVGTRSHPCATVRSSLVRTNDGGTAWQRPTYVHGAIEALAASMDGDSAWALVSGIRFPDCPGIVVCAGRVEVLPAGGSTGSTPPPSLLAGGYLLRALSPVDARTAWAVATGEGAGQSIIRTVDGGRSWQRRYETAASPSPGGLLGFLDAQRAWALGSATSDRAVLWSADGGLRWTFVGSLPAPAQFGGFATRRFGWEVTVEGQLYTTRDGGRAWTRGTAPPLCGGVSQGAGFTDPRHGWVLTFAQCTGESLYVTGDGGGLWTPASASALSAVAFTGARTAWAVWSPSPVSLHDHYLLARSADGGRSWAPVADLGLVTGTSPWSDAPLTVDPAGDVWLGTARSSDGGRTWTRYGLPPALAGQMTAGSSPVPRIAFVSKKAGWMVAADALWTTTDGGRTWREAAPVGAA